MVVDGYRSAKDILPNANYNIIIVPIATIYFHSSLRNIVVYIHTQQRHHYSKSRYSDRATNLMCNNDHQLIQ